MEIKARLGITTADRERFERLELSIAVERLERASVLWWTGLNQALRLATAKSKTPWPSRAQPGPQVSMSNSNDCKTRQPEPILSCITTRSFAKWLISFSSQVAQHLRSLLFMSKRNPMTPENMIKGRIAEAMIEELLRRCGNAVYRFGYESILQNLVQNNAQFDRTTKNGRQIRSTPDFVVVNPEGESFFVEVKFRSEPYWLKEKDLSHTREYWDAKVIIVTITQPYFRVARPRPFSESRCLFDPLELDGDLTVSSSAIQEFSPLVEQFLISAARGDREERPSYLAHR